MSGLFGKGRIGCGERIASAAIRMPTPHPELLTRIPSRAEWRQLTAWLAELWPNDEYTEIVADVWRRGDPPELQGRS